MTPPIGLFDSGLGGLSVALELMRRRPTDPLWVIGDTAHVPYGGRPLNEVHSFAMGLTDHLVQGGCRAVVMACNISSAVALEDARRHYGIPIFGMVDAGARAAATASPGNLYGVLATEGTVRSGAYTTKLGAIRPGATIVEVACPRFVPLVESGRWDSAEAFEDARECAAPLVDAGVETVILGCTHYPFLADAIRAAFPWPVRLVDPATAVVLEMASVLDAAPRDGDPIHRFEATGDPIAFSEVGSRLLDRHITATRCSVWDRVPAPEPMLEAAAC